MRSPTSSPSRRESKRRVVVTGLGAITPVGNDVATTWQSLLEGRSGAGPITKFDPEPFAVKFACEVKDFDPLAVHGSEGSEALRPLHAVRRRHRGAGDARRRSSTDTSATTIPNRLGVIVGSGIGGLATMEQQHDTYRDRGPVQDLRRSSFRCSSPTSRPASCRMQFNARGPNYATVSACATSAHAIGDAYRAIQYGDADLMITGGAEAAVTPMSIGGFANMRALSERNDEPLTASRPFDATRDGFVMGEGSATIVLEELEHAKARGATIYAEIVGYGATGDAYHLTSPAPNGEGAQRAMKRALDDAGLTPEDGAVRERARHVHAGQRPQRDEGDQGGVRRRGAGAERQLHQVRHRAHARRGGRGGVPRLARSWCARDDPAHDQLLHARSGVRSGLHAEHVASRATSPPR